MLYVVGFIVRGKGLCDFSFQSLRLLRLLYLITLFLSIVKRGCIRNIYVIPFSFIEIGGSTRALPDGRRKDRSTYAI